jgi:hypothetical protein
LTSTGLGWTRELHCVASRTQRVGPAKNHARITENYVTIVTGNGIPSIFFFLHELNGGDVPRIARKLASLAKRLLSGRVRDEKSRGDSTLITRGEKFIAGKISSGMAFLPGVHGTRLCVFSALCLASRVQP